MGECKLSKEFIEAANKLITITNIYTELYSKSFAENDVDDAVHIATTIKLLLADDSSQKSICSAMFLSLSGDQVKWLLTEPSTRVKGLRGKPPEYIAELCNMRAEIPKLWTELQKLDWQKVWDPTKVVAVKEWATKLQHGEWCVKNCIHNSLSSWLAKVK